MDFLSEMSVDGSPDLNAFVSTILDADPWTASQIESTSLLPSRSDIAAIPRPVDAASPFSHLIAPYPSSGPPVTTEPCGETTSHVTALQIPPAASTVTGLVSSSTDLSEHHVCSSSSEDVSPTESSATPKQLSIHSHIPPPPPRKIIAKASRRSFHPRRAKNDSAHFPPDNSPTALQTTHATQLHQSIGQSDPAINPPYPLASSMQEAQASVAVVNTVPAKSTSSSRTAAHSASLNGSPSDCRNLSTVNTLSRRTSDVDRPSTILLAIEKNDCVDASTTATDAACDKPDPHSERPVLGPTALSSLVPVTPIDMPPSHMLRASFANIAKHPPSDHRLKKDDIPVTPGRVVTKQEMPSIDAQWHLGDTLNNVIDRNSAVSRFPSRICHSRGLRGGALRNSHLQRSNTQISVNRTEHGGVAEPIIDGDSGNTTVAETDLSQSDRALESPTVGVTHSVYTNLPSTQSPSGDDMDASLDDSRSNSDRQEYDVNNNDSVPANNEKAPQLALSHTKMCRDRLNNMFDRLRETLPKPPAGVDIKHKAQVLDYTCLVLRNLVHRTANLEAELALSSMGSTAEWATRAVQEAQSFPEATRKVMSLFCVRREWTLSELWLTCPADSNHLSQFHLDTTLYRDPEAAARDSSLASFVKSARGYFGGTSSGVLAKAWSSMRPVWLSGLGDPQQFSRAPAAKLAGLQTCLAVPVLIVGRVEAVILFFDKSLRPHDSTCLEIAMRLTWALGNAVGAKRSSILQRNGMT